MKPLLWKIHEKSESDELWPKRLTGCVLVFLEKLNKYILIGGNFNAYENANKNILLNKEILSSNIENFNKLENAKRAYLTDIVYNSNLGSKSIDVYIYEQIPERKWFKVASIGRVPKARSFHRCIALNDYIFCFGGVELGTKGENASNSELYVFNPKTYEWKLISCEKYPYDRCDFHWIKLEKSAILFGGVSSPAEYYFDDMWSFKHDYDDFEFLKESKKEITKDYWCEVSQTGQRPGKIRAFSMEFSVSDNSIYLFGGLDSIGNNKNDLYKFNISNSQWEVVKSKGKSPGGRCYHEMALINKNNILLFGGISGSLSRIDKIYNDVFLFNINECVWVEPIVGGINPSPTFGFGYALSSEKSEIFIFGGYSETDSKYSKLYSISENESGSKQFWAIHDLNYEEEENDENFLIKSEQQIYEYKEKIESLEMEIRSKEIVNEDMRLQIEEFKKNIFKSHGFIDDQSQSLEDHIKELDLQKSKIKESVEYDKKITDYKLKLKHVMQRKVQKTMEFFCVNQALFIKYYDSLVKIINSKITSK